MGRIGISVNSQDKLDFLATEVMKDMTDLVAKVEAATKSISITKTALSSATEHQLIESIKQIEKLADSISTSKSGIEEAASAVVKNLLLGDDGPIKRLNDLFAIYQYNDRRNCSWMEVINERNCSWMEVVNKHTGSFFITTIFGGLLCGFFGGIVSGFILKVWH